MRRAIIVLAGIASVLAMADQAAARDGCGRGWFHNGVACVQEDDGYGAPYGRIGAPPPNMYGGPGGYYEPQQQRRPAPRQNLGNGMFRDSSGGVGCIQPGFTIQGGVCRPYSGR